MVGTRTRTPLGSAGRSIPTENEKGREETVPIRVGNHRYELITFERRQE
jgi:hypothetical protein